MVNPGPVPHVGGPVLSGAATVLIGFQPAARVGDSLTCVPAIDSIAAGEPTVLIENQPAARIGDPTTRWRCHCGGLPDGPYRLDGPRGYVGRGGGPGTPSARSVKTAGQKRQEAGAQAA